MSIQELQSQLGKAPGMRDQARPRTEKNLTWRILPSVLLQAKHILINGDIFFKKKEVYFSESFAKLPAKQQKQSVLVSEER
jgi:hypothetical protein